VKVFYCKFNDPVYVKLEKVEILVKVADKTNCD
jgi:AP-1 complex subunit beta-1